jgi:hypothetical protein
VELFDEVGGVFHAQGRDPSIFRFWITFSFDQVSGTTAVRCRSRVNNFFHFIVISFFFYNVWWGACVVRSMFLRLFVEGEKRVMEHRVYAPSGR